LDRIATVLTKGFEYDQQGRALKIIGAVVAFVFGLSSEEFFLASYLSVNSQLQFALLKKLFQKTLVSGIFLSESAVCIASS
jgi:hypothetical protein